MINFISNVFLILLGILGCSITVVLMVVMFSIIKYFSKVAKNNAKM